MIKWRVKEKIVEGVKCIIRKGLFIYVFRGRGGRWGLGVRVRVSRRWGLGVRVRVGVKGERVELIGG